VDFVALFGAKSARYVTATIAIGGNKQKHVDMPPERRRRFCPFHRGGTQLPKPSIAKIEDDTAPLADSKTERRNRELAFAISTVLVARRYRALLDDRLRPLGHGTARMEALSAIAGLPKLSPQTAIAKRIGIEGPTLTRMLDTLEAEGLVVRLADPSDRRTKLIQLTPAGGEALAEIQMVADGFRHQVLEELDDGELDGVTETLRNLLTRLNEHQFD
jgi:MarR family transcriptional regulator for hemolysin